MIIFTPHRHCEPGGRGNLTYLGIASLRPEPYEVRGFVRNDNLINAFILVSRD